MSIRKVLGAARQLVSQGLDELVVYAEDALSNRSPLEEKLDEALSKKNYGVPLTLLRDIAAETFDS